MIAVTTTRYVPVSFSPVDAEDAANPLVGGHEMGHALLNEGDTMHDNVPANNLLGIGGISQMEAYPARKRLTDGQNSAARNVGAGRTLLLQKK